MQALRLAAATAASAATAPRPWQQPGGIQHCYALQREHGRRHLAWQASRAQGAEADAPITVRLALRRFVKGSNYGHALARNGTTLFDLWIFPNNMPDYLNYLYALPLLSGGAARALQCRQSRRHPRNLFLINLKGPI